MKRQVLFLSMTTFFALNALAQTPYDNFAPEQSVKPIIEMPKMHFKVAFLAIRRGATSSATRRSIRSDRFQGRASRAPRTMCALLLPRPWSCNGFSSRTTSSASPRHGRLRVSARAAPRSRTDCPIPQGRFRAGI